MTDQRIEVHVYHHAPPAPVRRSSMPSLWLIGWPFALIGIALAGAALVIAAVGWISAVAIGLVLAGVGRLLVAIGWAEADVVAELGSRITTKMLSVL